MIDTDRPLSLAEYRYILKRDLPSFFEASFYELNPQTPYIPGPHIELMAQLLERCRKGQTRRAIINIPPRNLKSHCVSVAFPAWLLGHDPSRRIINVCYGQDLSDKMARDSKALMLSEWYQRLFPTRLSDRQATHDFETTASGGRMATSVSGVLTGRGGDMIILDDPMKPDEAISETQRNSVNDWFLNSLVSRLNDKSTGCIIIVMQRLHQDDLVGRVQELDNWEVLSFPAIMEEDRTYLLDGALGRRYVSWRKGEALHPAREPVSVLEGIRRTMGEYHFSAQYQQNPLPPGGAIVKLGWLRFYEPGSEPSRFTRIIQSWDTANKAGERNDFSVCTTWGVHKDGLYLLDVFRKRLMFPELKRALIQLRNQFRPQVILVEDKVSGTQLIQEARAAGISVTAYQPADRADKETRLHAQTSPFEGGRVFLRKDAPWLADYVAELTGFPGTKYDDQVDSTSQFLDYFSSRPAPLNITPEVLARAREPGPYVLKRMALRGDRIPCFF